MHSGRRKKRDIKGILQHRRRKKKQYSKRVALLGARQKLPCFRYHGTANGGQVSSGRVPAHIFVAPRKGKTRIHGQNAGARWGNRSGWFTLWSIIRVNNLFASRKQKDRPPISNSARHQSCLRPKYMRYTCEETTCPLWMSAVRFRSSRDQDCSLYRRRSINCL